MTSDAQHDLGVEPSETWKRERYTDQIAHFLPFSQELQPYRGKHKKDKVFVNKLLKDKGPRSYDWRIALSDLVNYYAPKPMNTSEDNDTLGLTPRSVQAAGSPTRYLCGSDGNEIPVRSVAPLSRNRRSFILARNVPLPIVWSEANLAAYVEALAESQNTQNRVPIQDKPKLRGWTNIGDIVTAFDTIFYGSASQKLLSIEACNTALRFFYGHGMIDKARSLYIRMEDLKMRIPTDTFNIMLRGSAWQSDLHNFTFLLSNMTRRGFKPDEVTWTLFLQVNESGKLREMIVRKMSEMKMLDKVSVRRNVASHIIYYEIASHLGRGYDHNSFLDHMNNKYGNGWLSTISGNKLLDEVAKRRSIAASLDLLYEMKYAGFQPDDVSMNTLLRRCLSHRELHLTFQTLNIFRHFYKFYPGPLAYETMFLQAWRSRLPNVCTVIWRAACAYGAVSFNLRRLVFKSLIAYRQAMESPRTCRGTFGQYTNFQQLAGRCVVPPYVSEAELVNQANSDPRRLDMDWKVAHILVDQSHHQSGSGRLESDLAALLRRALETDRTWIANGVYNKENWRDGFLRAISVPVKPVHHKERFSWGSNSTDPSTTTHDPRSEQETAEIPESTSL